MNVASFQIWLAKKNHQLSTASEERPIKKRSTADRKIIPTSPFAEEKLQKISKYIWDSLVFSPEVVFLLHQELKEIKELISGLAPSLKSQEFALFSKILNQPIIGVELSDGSVKVLVSSLYSHSACVKRWLADYVKLETIALTEYSTKTFGHYLSFCRGEPLEGLTLTDAWKLYRIADDLEATQVANICLGHFAEKISGVKMDDFESIKLLVEISHLPALGIPAFSGVKHLLEHKMSQTVQSFIDGQSNDEEKSKDIFAFIEANYTGPLAVTISVWPSERADRVFRLNVVELEIIELVGSLDLFSRLPDTILRIRFLACILDPSELTEDEMNRLRNKETGPLSGQEDIDSKIQKIKDQYEGKLEPSDTEKIGRLHQLIYLYLEDSVMGDRFYRHLPPTLEEIESKSTLEDCELIERFPKVPLELPKLTRCCIEGLNGYNLRYLPETIQYIETYESVWEIEAAESLRRMKDLRTLKLSDSTVIPEVIEFLPTGLEELELSCVNNSFWPDLVDKERFTDAFVNKLSSMSGLKRLNLGYCDIDVDCIIPCLPNTIEELYLYRTSLSTSCASSFSRLTHLLRLDLSCTAVNSEVISHLSNTIQYLDLWETSIDEKALLKIAEMRNLEVLRLPAAFIRFKNSITAGRNKSFKLNFLDGQNS